MKKVQAPAIVAWDWKDQPDWTAIAQALRAASVKFIYGVNTNQECYAVVVGAVSKRAA